MASTRTESTTKHLGRKNTAFELDSYGIKEPARVYWNLNTPNSTKRSRAAKKACFRIMALS
jgi:hypothetical protein